MGVAHIAWARGVRTGSPSRKAVLVALADHCNDHTLRCDPRLDLLADETELSLTTVKRAAKELVESGLIGRERRRRADGSLSVYTYTFPQVETTSVGQPGVTVAPSAPQMTRDHSGTAEPEEGQEQKQDLEPDARIARIGKVDRKPTSERERILAPAILAEWNVLANQQLRSHDWLRKIILRVREYPELGLAEHAHIIRYALDHPWWKGDPSPAVVYGNGALFEQHLTQAAKGDTSGSQGAFQVALQALNERRSA